MHTHTNSKTGYLFAIAAAMAMVLILSPPALSGDYSALKNVDGINVVFDVSMGSPQVANIVFWAVRNVYDDANVRKLPEAPHVAVVFHGPAVNLVSTDRAGFDQSDDEALEAFAAMIRQMKQDGVTFEVCDYALKVMEVAPETIFPEVDHVGNGFISVAGYQRQGYALVTIN